MVWRSIRDWDPQSRDMLAKYLHAAKNVVRAKQARPGVAVHVRLGASYRGGDQEDGPLDGRNCAGRYAVLAVTASQDIGGVVRVACSETAQTEVPRSAVQGVKCEEEALAAMVKTHCILDIIEPALDLLTKTSSSPQGLEQWTLAHVRTLERNLHDEFDPKRRLYGWARPGITIDREDFIDLNKVSKRVPGKTPAEVLCMWEDKLTGVFKLRGQWLIHADDLPKDASSRLRAARRSFSHSSHQSKGGTRGYEDEVFLTPRIDDLEIGLIVRPIMLSVAPSPGTETPVDLGGKMGPRLTHTYDDSTGDFAPVDATDPILKRARVRQSEAVAIASRANQKHATVKNGEPVTSTGWLLPKRRASDRKDGGDIGNHYHRGLKVDNESFSSQVAPVHVGTPDSAMDMDISDNSELKVVYNPNDEEWKEVNNDDSFMSSFCGTSKSFSSHQRRARAATTQGARLLPPRPRRLGMPDLSREGEPVAILAGGGDACTAIENHSRTSQTRSLSMGVAKEARMKISRALPRPSSSRSLTSTVRQHTRSEKRRRKCTSTSTTTTYASSANEIAEEEPDYPPRHTSVGKGFQADIPDLLSYEERERLSAETGARMVWRSIRDWDSQSRDMLAEYLHVARKVVRAKQARPGVAVHVRLGASYRGGDQEESPVDGSDCAGSYAVWAVTVSQDTSGVVRVACSETTQTEVPRSAVQEVQCAEEGLAGLVKTHCTLDNTDPALDLLTKTSSGPQSLEQWTLPQVRTLERSLDDEFDPKRRLHGWARPGITMDREDFIDLSKVSKRVSGKTPAEAAGARRQEKVLPDCQVDRLHYLGGGPASGCNRIANLRAGSTQTSDGSQRASSGNLMDGVGSGSGNNLPERQLSSSKSQVPRLQSLKPSQDYILKASQTDVDQSTIADTSAGHVDYKGAEPPLCQATIGQRCSSVSAPNVLITRRNRSSSAVDDIATAGYDPAERQIESIYTDDQSQDSARQGATSGTRTLTKQKVDGDADGGRAYHSVILHGTRTERNVAGRFLGLPPEAGVFEVQESGDETHCHVHHEDKRRTSPPIPDVKTPSVMSVVEVAANNLNTLGSQGLKCAASQMCSSSGSASAPTVQLLPQTYSLRPQPAALNNNSMERPRMDLASYTPYAVQRRDAGLTEGQRHAIWDRRSALPPSRYAPHVQRPVGGYIHRVDGSRATELRAMAPDSHIQHIPEKARTDAMYGVMAPCSRILERAKAYIDKDQLVYMRELMLTYVKKPMSRDQLLERAESFLQQQGHIFAAFVKMFDRINESPSTPLYPVEKEQAGPSPSSSSKQITPYSSTYVPPAVVSKHPGSAYVPTPRAFREEKGGYVTVHPGSSSGIDINPSPLGGGFPHPHPVVARPGGGSCTSTLGGGSGDLAKNHFDRCSPATPITRYSRRDAPHLADSFYGRGNASGTIRTQDPLHQSLHQPPQWRIDSIKASVSTNAEAVKKGEARRGST